jgi:hypothetical protein
MEREKLVNKKNYRNRIYQYHKLRKKKKNRLEALNNKSRI